jgi:cobalamin biosynthesis Mg chelatase CobN
MNALTVFTSSLRVREHGVPVAPDRRRPRRRPDLDAVVRVGRSAGHQGSSAFERLNVPIIQAITSGMPREAWEVSLRG